MDVPKIRQRRSQAIAIVDEIPVRSRISSLVCETQHEADQVVLDGNENRASLCLETPSPNPDGFSNTYSNHSAPDEDISPTSSVIDAMEELFIHYSQSETHDSTAGPGCARFPGPSCQQINTVKTRHSGRDPKQLVESSFVNSLKYVWPKCPIGMANAPMMYFPTWKDQDIFWNDLRQHICFQGRDFPPKCDRDIWVQGHVCDLNTTEAVVYKAKLRFDHLNQIPKLELEIPVYEKGSRLRRKFGFNQFMELQLLFSNRCKKILSDQDKKEALAKWFVWERHPFLSRKWVALFIENTKPVKEQRGFATHTWIGKHVTLFCEQEEDLNFASSFCGTASQPNVLSASKSSDFVSNRYALLDWLLSLNQNADEPYIKLFHRISLGLSKTTPTITLAEHSIRRRVTDIKSRKGLLMNDGIGRISYSLLQQVRHIMRLDYLPAAIQGRIGSAKGIWMLDIASSPSDAQWIETYPSQEKWDCNWSDPVHRTLEVLTASSELRPAELNLQFIPILQEQAIDQHLMRTVISERIDQHLRRDLDDVKKALETPEYFRRWIQTTASAKSGDSQHIASWFVGGLPMDWPKTMSFLADGGFDPRRLEFLNTMMYDHQMKRWERMQKKLKIGIAQSTYALMTVDFQGILAPNEVHLCFSRPFDNGNGSLYDIGGFDVLVARCPAHLPSDIQKVKAVFKPELRHLKDIILFSSLGDESLASKLSGGDYDGDKAWVCWDPDIVNNFESAEVPSTVSFDEYFRPNTQKLGNLVSRHGEPDYIEAFFEEAFNFHLGPSFMGVCTSYKENLSYHLNSVGNETIVNLSMLLSNLVDQEKSGFEFNETIWRRIRKEKCGGKMFLQVPAYKTGDLGTLSTSSHPIDSLKFSMHQSLNEVLQDFSTYRQNSGTGTDRTKLADFDPELVAYWDDFEKEAERVISLVDSSSCWLRDLRSSLIREIDACLSHWGKAMSGKHPYPIKVIPVYERWKKISPPLVKTSAVATIMTSSFDVGTALGKWELLKASLTFKRHHRCTTRMRRDRKDDMLTPVPIVSRIYRTLRPDRRLLERVLTDNDQDSDDD
ncbi:hypothetical protein FLONG3_3922 [Fusarium longipes]|uniref:RNA-dependent RNA polymerase n=1 Tax=Fusarium longipes TaxID=694270 RepID=A0A395T162_9HYPO|nr:hypothetical protein FLONG3_3922 [Fusarium longipes]